ncbi:hypothetical protein C8J57DRAFT_1473433 [Mycena rebaudengoi]|nr:hypothetical protein C8J57DRAFT_1473433 [Mycena rebaudengoi]
MLLRRTQHRLELQNLLVLDQRAHHVFFNDFGFHNHLSHHLVAAYDLGAPPALMRLIYENTEKILRPMNPTGEEITEGNWTTRLGEHKAYGRYFAFFLAQIKNHGIPVTFHTYIMAPEANANGALMFARFFGGALHPFLQVGFGVEFGQDYMVAAGLAWTAVEGTEIRAVLDTPSGLPQLSTSPKDGATLLSLLREVYDSPALAPVPYNPALTIADHFKNIAHDHVAASAAIKRIYAQWPIATTLTGAASDAEFASKIEECFVQATLLLAATSKPNRVPRPDFFLMHLVTSALALCSLLKIIPHDAQKAQMLQGCARASAMLAITRGRPRIDIPLLMSYSEHPQPPAAPTPHNNTSTLDDTRARTHVNPWLAIVHNALQHKEPHVVKTVRALYYAAQQYGGKGAGEAIGAVDEKGEETHRGAREADGSIFVRAAGMVSQRLGWVAFGREESRWDFSGMGWDAAWEKDD